jgi:hypothetical protein
MKLVTLKGWFLHRARKTKLYIIDGAHPPQFVLAGFAFNPREDGDALKIDLGPYVVYSLERDTVLKPERTFLGLRLATGSEVTRKYQTHCRNVKRLVLKSGSQHLLQYLQDAWSLRDDDRGSQQSRAEQAPCDRE